MGRFTRLTGLGLAIFLVLSCPVPLLGLDEQPHTAVTKPITPLLMEDFPLPEKLSLCGEPMPLKTRYAYEMLDREFTIVVWNRAQVYMWLKRAGRFFPHIEKRLAEEGLPTDLKYLAVTESSLIPHIRSRAGALGTWQFMASTGRRHGLKKEDNFDERLNFFRSTEAAIKYLKRLKRIFGKWNLALAAYNCGEGCVTREIKEQGVRDYYRLNLPLETERFVFRMAAIKIVLENPQKYGYYLAPERIYAPLEVDRVQISLAEDIHFKDAAKAIGTDYKVLKELNPEIHGRSLPEGRYEIFVPAGLGGKTSTCLKQTRPTKLQKKSNKYYLVKRGDTLSRISKRTRVPIKTLRQLNRIRGSYIQAGQKLRLGK